MSSYRLPNLKLADYQRLSSDEQYLLISSIHALYERMLGVTPPSEGAAPTLTVAPAPAPEAPVTPSITYQPMPYPENRAAPQRLARRMQNGGIRALIIQAIPHVGAELTGDVNYARVTATTPYSTHGVRALLHRMFKDGTLERCGRARYRLRRES